MSHFHEAQTPEDLPPEMQGEPDMSFVDGSVIRARMDKKDARVNREIRNRMNGVKEMSLLPAEAQPAGIPVAEALLPMIERLASNKDFDVAKLEKMIEMQERIMRHNAKAAFDAAFSKMQAELPEIDEKGQILNKDRITVRSTYAKLEDIHAAIKPVLKTHGFAIRHRTEWPADKPTIIRIVGILSHEQGHSEESAFEAPADKSDYRTDIQSQGSTVSYGRRYTTLDLLNLTTRGLDNDGQGKPPEAPKAPEGFQTWWDGMNDVVPEGLTRYAQLWSNASATFREFVNAHLRDVHEARKTKAQWHDKQRAGGK